MYCMHLQKGVSEAPRTHFRARTSSKFSGPQTPLPQSILWAPLFVFALGPSHPLGGPVLVCNGCDECKHGQNAAMLQINIRPPPCLSTK